MEEDVSKDICTDKSSLMVVNEDYQADLLCRMLLNVVDGILRIITSV